MGIKEIFTNLEDETYDHFCSQSRGTGKTYSLTEKITGNSHLTAQPGKRRKEGGGTYTAHEVQECGSDGWVGLHGVMHDQNGWLWRMWN